MFVTFAHVCILYYVKLHVHATITACNFSEAGHDMSSILGMGWDVT